ncbi:protein root UVB sensitive 4 isoform X1 [Humulus lupulus]|uniref:protein root UVB sensitive 4 isoform X1 n=1 Tax=Humulus lupulus TaxID=3486 RepID=UPI002B40CA67|nr:protein root UVB sensitive 4 isoform X1 [Humulus lupulus]
MQSFLHPPSNFNHLPYPWTTIQQPQLKTQIFVPPKTCLRILTIASSLRTSIDYGCEPEESVSRESGRLPVAIHSSGSVSRYLWDGNNLQLVGVDGGSTSFSFDFDDGLRNLGRVCSLAIRDFLIPKKVSKNYIEYVKWKCLHRIFSSALQVLATQAMFRAIGIGYSRSLPSAAALNWVLKDGLGRLSRCIYTASLASAFDTNLKRVRFSTSVLFTLGIGVELLTPLFPKYFLLLASIANIAKQISLACVLATGSAVHRSFALADNLGEVSAKSQIQTVCFDNLGLLLAAFLNVLFKNNQRLQAGLPFIVYPIFSAIDLFGIYQELKHVHLQTLTKDRLEVILNTWVESGYVPSPAEVSKLEGIDFPWTKGKDLWPIRIGCLNPKDHFSKMSMVAMQSLSSAEYYFISMETFHSRMPRRVQQGIIICLREGATTGNVIMGLLQACYIRKALHLNKSRWEKILEASDLPESVLNEWLKLLKECKVRAQDDLCLLNAQMKGLGWTMKNILLSTQEQNRYSFIDD